MNNKPEGSVDAQLELHKSTIDEIFTRDNLPAILAVLNSLLPRDVTRISVDEFQTIARAARYDGAINIINDVITFTGKNGK